MRLHRRERHRLDGVRERRAECPERLQHARTLGRIAAIAGDDAYGRCPVRCAEQPGVGSQLVRRRSHEVAIVADHRAGLIAGMDDQAAQHGRHRVRPVQEGGDDPEIAAAAAQRPEQIGIVLRARGDDGAIRRDDLEGQDIVAGQPVLARPASRRRRPGSGRQCRSSRRRRRERPGRAGWVSRSTSPSVAPPCTRTVRRSGSTNTPPLTRDR